MSTLVTVLAGLVPVADPVPSEDQIGAGWGAVVVFVLLAAAIIFLAFSLTKHLRKARTNAEHGAFGKDDEA
jgi:hypothetical protein